MKKIFMSAIVCLVMLSGSGYAAYGKDYAAASSKMFLKRFEQAFLKQQSKVELGSLSVYQEELVKGFEKQHPNFTKITNLGRLSHSLLGDCTAEKTALSVSPAKYYLLEVQEGRDVFYYEVTVDTIRSAPSDVIPAHTSAVSVVVKPIGETELRERLTRERLAKK